MYHVISLDKSEIQYFELIKNIFDEFKNHFENTAYDDFYQPLNDPNNIWLKHLYDLPIIINIVFNDNFIWANKCSEEFLGFINTNYVNKNSSFSKRIHPEDFEELQFQLNNEENDAQYFDTEFRMLDLNKEFQLIHTMITPKIFSKQLVDCFRIFAYVTSKSKKNADAIDKEFTNHKILMQELELLFNKEIQLEQELFNKGNTLKLRQKELQEKDEYLLKIQNLLEQGKQLGEKNKKFFEKIGLARRDIFSKEDWLKLEQEFIEGSPKYLTTLAADFPHLTKAEIKICAMIKLNMRTKEIADNLCVSQKTIDNHRLSIRRKLRLEESTRLSVFLMNY